MRDHRNYREICNIMVNFANECMMKDKVNTIKIPERFFWRVPAATRRHLVFGQVSPSPLSDAKSSPCRLAIRQY